MKNIVRHDHYHYKVTPVYPPTSQQIRKNNEAFDKSSRRAMWFILAYPVAALIIYLTFFK